MLIMKRYVFVHGYKQSGDEDDAGHRLFVVFTFMAYSSAYDTPSFLLPFLSFIL